MTIFGKKGLNILITPQWLTVYVRTEHVIGDQKREAGDDDSCAEDTDNAHRIMI